MLILFSASFLVTFASSPILSSSFITSVSELSTLKPAFLSASTVLFSSEVTRCIAALSAMDWAEM